MNRDPDAFTPQLRSWHCQIGSHINIPLANRIIQRHRGSSTRSAIRIVQVEFTKDTRNDQV